MTARERNPAEVVPWQLPDARAHALQLVILINRMGGKRRHHEAMDPGALAVTEITQTGLHIIMTSYMQSALYAIAIPSVCPSVCHAQASNLKTNMKAVLLQGNCAMHQLFFFSV